MLTSEKSNVFRRRFQYSSVLILLDFVDPEAPGRTPRKPVYSTLGPRILRRRSWVLLLRLLLIRFVDPTMTFEITCSDARTETRPSLSSLVCTRRSFNFAKEVLTGPYIFAVTVTPCQSQHFHLTCCVTSSSLRLEWVTRFHV